MAFPKLTIPPETSFQVFKDSMQRWLNAAEPYWNGTKVISSTVINNYFNTFNIIMPEKYGAVGDYNTDDTVAIQAAVNAAWALADTFTLAFRFNSVVPVVFSPGKHYRITDTIYLPGMQAFTGFFDPTFATSPQIIMATDTGKDMFVVTDPGVGASLTVHNMSFASYSTSGYVFNLPATYDGGAQTIASVGIGNCKFNYAAAEGCVYYENANDFAFYNNTIDAPSSGVVIRVKTGREMRLYGNEIYVIPYFLLVEDYATGVASLNTMVGSANGAFAVFLNGRDDFADLATRQAYYAGLEAAGTLYGGGLTKFDLSNNTIEGDTASYDPLHDPADPLSPASNNQVGVLIGGLGDCELKCSNTYNYLDYGYYDVQSGTATVETLGETWGTDVTYKVYQALGATSTTFKGNIHRASGTTAQRPAILLTGNAGQWYDDSDVGHNVYWDGTQWMDELVTNGDAHDHVGGDGAQIDHGGTAGLTDDDHTQYLKIAGRATGQTAYGGTASGDDLTIESTSNATKGDVLIQTSGGSVGIGTSSPDTILHIAQANATPVVRLERNDATIGTDDIVGRIEVEGQDAGAQGVCAKLEAIGEGNDGETGWRFSTGIAGAPAETMRLTYTGYLGIGVTEPDAQLHVEHATGAVQRLTRNDTTVAATDIIGRIEFETRDSTSAGVGAYVQGIAEGTAGEVGLSFATGVGGSAAEQLRIDSDGAVIATNMVRQGSTWHAYGGFQDEDETIAIATVDVWVHITNVTNDLWTGLEADGLTLSNDVMTITNAGDYVGSVSVTIAGLNGKDFQIRCYNVTQAAQMGYEIGATTTGATNFTNITLPLYLECDAGDELRMEIRCITDASDPICKSAVFYLAYLHD